MNDEGQGHAGVTELESARHGRAERRLRRARRLVLGYVLLMVAFIPGIAVAVVVLPPLLGTPGIGWRGWVGLPLSAVLAVVVFRMLRVRLGSRPAPGYLDLWLSFPLMIAFAAVYGFTPITGVVLGLWWGSIVLVGSRIQSMIISALVLTAWVSAAVALAPQYPIGEILFVLLYGIGMAILSGLGHLGFFMLWDIAQEAHTGRDAQARLAVSEERLRFARDMHDLLGHSLSAIAAKSQLAARLAERDPGQASSEMLAVQAAAREALREVRTAISGYREVDVAEELANVRMVLEAAGVRCTIHGGEGEPSTGNRVLAAWIVREGGTNVLRHSSATECEITVRSEGSTCVVEVYNDGAAGDPTTGDPVYGNGLSGLSERVSAAGGTLTASSRIGGGFLLRALLPEEKQKSGARERPVRAEDVAP
jgi:two-component system, NarL family, sensor histidine kinase DesK